MRADQLIESLENGDEVAAVEAARSAFGNGRHPLQVMVVILHHLGRLRRINETGASTVEQAAEALGLRGSHYPAERALAWSQAMGGQRIEQVLLLAIQAEDAIKAGERDAARSFAGELTVERLIVELCNRRPAPDNETMPGYAAWETNERAIQRSLPRSDCDGMKNP